MQVLVDAAYETKRMRSMLAENMAARMSLESQRREEIIVYNRELREKSTAQKAKVPRRAGGGGGLVARFSDRKISDKHRSDRALLERVDPWAVA